MAEITREDKEELQKGLMREALKFQRIWQEEVPVYRGIYRSEISVEKTDNWGVKVGVTGEIAEKAKKLEYGLPVDEWPDLNEIQKWAERKLGLPEDEARRAAYPISRKLFFEGPDENASLHRAINKYRSQS